MNSFFKTRVQDRMRILNVVWMAMLASSLVFGFLLFSKPPVEGAPPLADLAREPFVQTLVAAALITFFLSRAVGGFLLKPERLKALRDKPWTAEALAAEKNEGVPVYRPEDIPKFMEFSERERLQWLALQPYFVAKIVAFALSESAGVMGFLVANQYHQPQAYLPFAALSVLGFLLARPGENEVGQLVS